MVSNKEKISAVNAALSLPRMTTYIAAAGVSQEDDLSALELYAWNAAISGALLAPLHICEVVIRNAVADALEAVYGNRWPWSLTFERSLPAHSVGYNPQKDLQSARSVATTTGMVIPELKLVFWQKMFTRRYDARLWDIHLKRVLPNLDVAQSVASLRQVVYFDLEQLRKLRNRIAHHEPIFSRNLNDDLTKVMELVRFRCSITAQWMKENNQANSVIAAKP
jgi:hypothetical protein